jgi:hypothetical protein
MGSALNTEDLISNTFFYSVGYKDISNVISSHFINKVTDFWSTLYNHVCTSGSEAHLKFRTCSVVS